MSTTPTKLKNAMDPDRVSKMMFLRLIAGHMKELEFINTGMAKISTKQEEARQQASLNSQKAKGGWLILYRTRILWMWSA